MDRPVLLPEAATVKAFVDTATNELLAPIQRGQEGLSPTPQNLRTWLNSRKPQSTTLFKNDPATVIRPGGADAAAAATGGR